MAIVAVMAPELCNEVANRVATAFERGASSGGNGAYTLGLELDIAVQRVELFGCQQVLAEKPRDKRADFYVGSKGGVDNLAVRLVACISRHRFAACGESKWVSDLIAAAIERLQKEHVHVILLALLLTVGIEGVPDMLLCNGVHPQADFRFFCRGGRGVLFGTCGGTRSRFLISSGENLLKIEFFKQPHVDSDRCFFCHFRHDRLRWVVDKGNARFAIIGDCLAIAASKCNVAFVVAAMVKVHLLFASECAGDECGRVCYVGDRNGSAGRAFKLIEILDVQRNVVVLDERLENDGVGHGVRHAIAHGVIAPFDIGCIIGNSVACHGPQDLIG